MSSPLLQGLLTTGRYWCPSLQQDIDLQLTLGLVCFELYFFPCFLRMADVTAEENDLGEKPSSFSSISEDILINIFSKLEEDPRHLASLACVCPRFNSIIRSVCWKRRCMSVIPAVVADLLQANGRADRPAEPPGGWSALQKLAVCCPGLWHAGILLENSDLGLERAIGPSHQYPVEARLPPPTSNICSEGTSESYSAYPWTIFDDINFHVEYEAELGFTPNPKEEGFSGIGNRGFAGNPNGNIVQNSNRAPENPSGGDVGNGVGESPSEQIAKKPNIVAEHPIGEMVEGFRDNPCAVTGNSIGEKGEGSGANPCAVAGIPIGEIAYNAEPNGEIEDNTEPIGGAENPNGVNGNGANKLNQVVENPVGEMGNGITQNQNGQIPGKPNRAAENPIWLTGESCKGNSCASRGHPNGEVAVNADLSGGTVNSDGENINIAKSLNRVAENRIGEMGNGVAQDPNGEIPDKPNRVAENPTEDMGDSCKSNRCAVTEWPSGKIIDNAAESPNGENRNFANTLNQDSGNVIGQMGNGITQCSNGQIPDRPNGATEIPTGEMDESCQVHPRAVRECLNAEITDHAFPIGETAGVEGNTSEFSKSIDSPSGASHKSLGVTYNSRDPIEVKRKENPSYDQAGDHQYCDAKKRKKGNLGDPHLASDIWNLTREQGNKLLASRFRGDSLYICDWPGCLHSEEKRNYRLFRGIFKNFRNSYVWRNIRDMKAEKSLVNCAFCSSTGTWDMLAAFCLRRSFEYHDDGEPSVRAYVCENGHVAGAWTDRPMYK